MRRLRLIGWAGMILPMWMLLAVPVLAAPDASKDLLRRNAEQFEKARQWAKAFEIYADLLGRDRNGTEIRERYHVCLRHLQQIRRHQDKSFRETVLNHDMPVALKLYGEVLAKLKSNYLEKDLTSFSRFFQQGLEEFRFALEDDTFRQIHLPDAKVEDIRYFFDALDSRGKKSIRRLREVQDLVLDVALEAQKVLRLKPTVTILEFACGACSGLDEYTLFLTPSQINEIFHTLDGDLPGVGLELEQMGDRLEIIQVAMGSSAALAGIKVGDVVLRIDGKPVKEMNAEQARERLRGEPGATVELEVLSLSRGAAKLHTLARQAVKVVTVLDVRMTDQQAGIGYLRVANFHKTTPEDLDAAILQLKMQGMRVLIVDLRGNGGGLFPTAIQVAERFLPSGLIVSTQSRLSEYNRSYESNNLNALTMPLVVLVDGETASAAEVLAGALKENRRATLVGQNTFGKGSIQGFVQLDTVAAGGIRITLAKFFSPRGQAYSGAGIAPHISVERTSMGLDEAQLAAAMQVARELGLMNR